MTSRRTVYALCALGLFVAVAPRTSAQQDGEQVTVSWSDPGRPGTVEIESPFGGMTIKGGDRKDVQVIALGQPQSATGGLKSLTKSRGFSVKEDRNVMEIESQSKNRTLDFEVHVPLRTNLKILAHSGVITIDNVDGDMELSNSNGSILMTNVGGSIVANSNNGELKATMTRLASKAMAFTTLNGTVDVTLPGASKSTIKLRSDMGGDVFTDFDVRMTPLATPRRDGGGRVEIEVTRTIQGTINGGGPEIGLRTFNGNIYLRKGK